MNAKGPIGNDPESEATTEPSDMDAASVTRLLNQAGSTRDGLDQVFYSVYAELKRIAHRVLAGGRGSTLSPTVLVHEVYAKLIGSESLSITGRKHFFALCARTMRQIVVDYARSKLSEKRGGGRVAVELTDDGLIDIAKPETLVAMDEALNWLEERDPRLVELIHYRVYAGMQLPEIAPLFEVTARQLQRDWKRARMWLTEALIETRN